MKKPAKRKGIFRLLVQIFFFALIALIAVNKSLEESGAATIPFLSTASLHALCPFGGVVTLYNLITVGTLIQKIHASSVILLGLVLVLAILFGPVFCGWVCPLGSAQEWVGRLGRKIFKKKHNHFIPHKLDKWLRYLRFIVLVWVVFVTARSATLLFANVDPYHALFTFWTKEAALPAVIILGVTLIASLFIERPWCKYLCPYGALLGLFNKIRIFKIRRQPATCISCNRCSQVCPMNIDVAKQDKVTDFQCISCYECTSERACPVADTVDMALASRKAAAKKPRGKAPVWLAAVLILVVIFGGIGVTVLTGDWVTESEKTPSKYTTGESAGEYNPEDIRGSYTFSDVSEAFGIDLAVLYDAFGIPAGTDGSSLHTKDVEATYGDAEIGNGSVQMFVALYKNLPIALVDTYLTKRGAEIVLEANPSLTQEQKDYLTAHQIDTDTAEPTVVTQEESAAEPTDAETEEVIKGAATFQQALDAGLTSEQIEAIIGDTLPAANMAIRDYCTEKGLSFSEIKSLLNDAIGAAQ